MTISITDDIKSVTELKRNTNEVLQHVHDTGRPVVLTVNGKAEAVLLDAKEYERMVHALGMLKLLIRAEEDINTGRLKEAGAFFKEFRHARKV